MKAVDFNQPELLKKIFAVSGDKNVIPVDYNNTSDPDVDDSQPQRADLTHGFPPITSESPDDGGLPPERKDFNALGYLTTSYDFFYQAGGTFTFSSTISTAIGGYPKGARLWHTNSGGVSMILRSTKDDNTDDFTSDESYIGTSWVIESMAGIDNSSVGLLDFKFSDKRINKMSWVLSDNSWLSSSTYSEAYTHLFDDVGFQVLNDSGTVKIQVSAGGFTAGDYVRSSADDMTISGTSYYAWKYSTSILYVTLDTTGMSADDAVSALQGQVIYTYADSSMSLTVHKITIATADTYTINGSSVSLNVLVGSDGHRIVLFNSTEADTLNDIYGEYGIAWYYLLDKTGTRFKLPRTKYGVNGYRGKVGGYIPAGAPNITGNFKLWKYVEADGAFYKNGSWGSANSQDGGSDTTNKITFDASRSSSVYGNSNTIQPPATECYLYFYVGAFNDTAVQQTAGITSETINAKMDTDAGNATDEGKAEVISWGRNFTNKNTTVANGGASIAGSYNLGMTDTTSVKLGLFTCTLATTQNGHSTMALSTDVVTNAVLVCGTNNLFYNDSTVMLPFKNRVTISFPNTGAGVGSNTKLIFKGYM